MPSGRHERLDFAERWLRDGLDVLRPATSFHHVTVNMTAALARLDAYRQQGVHATATHLLVSAAARALAASPDLHTVAAGRHRLKPATIDVGLSVTGTTFVAPVLLIEAADRLSIAELVAEIERRTPEAQRRDREMLESLRRWGWLVPFAPLRRAVLRALFSRPSFRQRGTGSLQVSTTAAEWAASSSFASAGVLVGGRVMRAVMPVDGAPAVCPAMHLTLSVDHGVWDGRSASRLLASIQDALETPPETAA